MRECAHACAHASVSVCASVCVCVRTRARSIECMRRVCADVRACASLMNVCFVCMFACVCLCVCVYP